MIEPGWWRAFHGGVQTVIVVLALLMSSSVGCGDERAAPDAFVGSERCTAGVPDLCPTGQLCANDRCKAVCPGPGGVGQSCGRPGSMCCGLGERCRVGSGELACTSSCTPFSGGCPDGFGCQILSDGLLEFSDCRVAGSGIQGSSCSSSAECAPGFLCVDGSNPSCHRYCLLDDLAHGCESGTTCHTWSILDAVIYGICY